MESIQCDLLLFVTTSTEYNELKRAAISLGLRWEKQSSLLGDYWILGALGDYRIAVVRTEMGAIGPFGSTRHAHCLLSSEAQNVICLGMGFGISRALQPVGTVLVSDALFPYDVRNVIPDPRDADDWIYSYDAKARHHAAATYPAKWDLRDLLKKHAASKSWEYIIQFGSLLTGSARIRSSAYRDELVRRCTRFAPSIVGGEMEGLGLLSLAERELPRWIVVKGVCDFADERQVGDAKANRRIACANAAHFVLDALSSRNPLAFEVSNDDEPGR